MAETVANQTAADMKKLASASNPLLVVQNPIVVNASLGVLAAYMARKWVYSSFRDQFGWASKGPDGKIHYYAVKKDAKGNVVPDTSKEVPGAYLNRVLLNLGGVVLGTLLINNTVIEDASADYIGLGVAAGSFANLIMAMFQID